MTTGGRISGRQPACAECRRSLKLKLSSRPEALFPFRLQHKINTSTQLSILHLLDKFQKIPFPSPSPIKISTKGNASTTPFPPPLSLRSRLEVQKIHTTLTFSPQKVLLFLGKVKHYSSKIFEIAITADRGSPLVSSFRRVVVVRATIKVSQQVQLLQPSLLHPPHQQPSTRHLDNTLFTNSLPPPHQNQHPSRICFSALPADTRGHHICT